MTDGQKLKLVRGALMLSQRELAAELRTSQGVISAVELDKQKISRRVLELLRDRYRLNMDWFINERGEMFGKAVDISTITGSDKDEIIRILKEQNHILMSVIEDKSRIIELLEHRLLTKNEGK